MDNNGKKDAAERDELWGRVMPLYEELILRLKKRLDEKDDDVARDALHTVLVRLAKGKSWEFEDWKTYLTKCAVNEHHHEYRNGRLILFSELSKEDRGRLYEIPGPERTPADQAAEREISAILWKEIEKLPRRQRQVMTLDLEERTEEEIRAILGVKSLATVRSHRRKAFARLRKKLPNIFLDE